jgi:hypothetical protein
MSVATMSGKREIGSFLQIFSESFFEIFGKRIDGRSAELLVGNLSLIGKLFEIYFVRLIGTPNQQFNIRLRFIVGVTLVVQNH